MKKLMAILIILCLSSTSFAGVFELRQLGNTADKIASGVGDINSIHNTLGPRYDSILALARTLTGNPTLLLADLTDNQINVGLLEGRGTPEDIAETKAILIAWEVVILAVRGVVDTLPSVNE